MSEAFLSSASRLASGKKQALLESCSSDNVQKSTIQSGISCFEEISMLIEGKQESDWLRLGQQHSRHINKGRSALTSAEENINVYKLL